MKSRPPILDAVPLSAFKSEEKSLEKKEGLLEKRDPEWSECKTLLEWVEMSLKAGKGNDSEVIAAIRMLPVEKREPYRALWRKYRGMR